ncbi:MAG TPA: hypothetical protein VFS97_09510 [Nitrososphaeraceae archaeon]|nr:hypothetical protein [Nitrososphaeraceae archaeon]
MSVIVYGNENRVFYSNSPDYDHCDPFTVEIRFSQVHTVRWTNAYSGFLKAWIDNIKLTKLPCENSWFNGRNTRRTFGIRSH